VVLLALAAFLRLAPVASCLPYISYVDEGHVLHPAIEILRTREFDPRRFTYPPLTSYLIIVAAKAYGPIYRLTHHHSLRSDLPRAQDFQTELGENYDLITPPEIVLLGRIVVACLSIGIVMLAGALARRLAGPRAGLLAMLFAAVCPALVSRGSIAIIDTTAAFFAIATFYFCERLRTAALEKISKLWRFAALAGGAAGLAFGGKYTVGLVFVAVPITIAALPRPLIAKAPLLVVSLGGLILGLYAGVPIAVLHPERIVHELHTQARFYQSIRSEQNYLGASLSSSEVGIILFLGGCAGLAWMIARRSTRMTGLSWLAFAVMLLITVGWTPFQPFRNLLSLVPLLCIALAFLFAQTRRTAALIVVGLLCTAQLVWATTKQLQARLSKTDTRIQAIDWLRQHAPSDGKILGIRELAILPSEWKHVSPNTIVVPWFEAADILQQQHFDYVVTGNFDLRYATDPPRWAVYRDRWLASITPYPNAAQFGSVPTPVVPYLWRTNDERIVILKGADR
jgi:hypothetical protein